MSSIDGRKSSRSGISNVQTLVILVIAIVAALGVGGLLTLAFFLPSGSIIGSGNLVTEEKSFSNFTIVNVERGFEVVITQSSSYSVSITADDNLLDLVQISKIGETLDISVTSSISVGIPRPLTLRVEITMPELRELELSTGVRGFVTGFTSSEMFVLDLDTGSSVEVDGAANEMIITASGGSTANLSNLRVDNADVNLNGGSRATISVDGRLDADVTGGSTLSYIGEPTLGTINTSGGSTVRKI